LTANIVARRYAKALFAIGLEKGDAELEAYGKDLAAVAEAIAAAPQLLRIFPNPLFSVEEKKAVAAKILEKIGPNRTTVSFVNLLADKNRLASLPEIEAYFRVLLDQQKGVIRGQLLTAVDLDDAKQAQVKDQLKAQLGKDLVLEFATDPAILGGVVLKVGDKILDASLRAQLQNIKETIKRGE
jgi:F-type H+-transporting ATPase subunit delta